VRRAKLTTKKLAQRIDLNYFKRSHPLRRWRFTVAGRCRRATLCSPEAAAPVT
jgi:hypothetical protein